MLARWGRLLAEIKRPMTRRRFELVTFVVAYELRNSVCALVHGKALAEFYSPDTVRAIAEDLAGDALSEADQVIVRFARQVAHDASRITPGPVEQLKRHGLTDAEIFDIAAIAAGRAFFTKLLDALGVEADSSCLEYDEQFRRALTVGRPVDFRPVVRLPGTPARRAGTG